MARSIGSTVPQSAHQRVQKMLDGDRPKEPCVPCAARDNGGQRVLTEFESSRRLGEHRFEVPGIVPDGIDRKCLQAGKRIG